METKDKAIPKRFTIDCPNPNLRNPVIPYNEIIHIASDLIQKNKTVSSAKLRFIDKLLSIAKKYVKNNSSSLFNLRMKKKVLEYDGNKISNFIILKVAHIVNSFNSICYDCYYTAPLDGSNGFIIALPDSEDIKEYLYNLLHSENRFAKYKLYTDNLDKLFSFADTFQLYLSASEDPDIRAFSAKKYRMSESKEYIDYLAEQAGEEAKQKIYEEKYDAKSNEQSEETPDIKVTVNVPLPHHNYYTDVYDKLAKLLSVSDNKTIMFLLGYFISYNFNTYLPREYRFSVNLQVKDVKDAERMYNILFSLLFEEDESKPLYFDKSDKFSSQINKSDYMTLISTTADFNKSDKQYIVDIIEKYYSQKPKRCPANFILASKKDIVSKNIENKVVPSVNNAAIAELKSDISIFQSKHEFFEYMRCLLSYDKDMIEKDLSERKRNLKKTSALSGNELYRYTPVVYFLEKYFQFLLDSESITSGQFEELLQICSSLYTTTPIKPTTDKAENIASIEDTANRILTELFAAYNEGKLPIERLSVKPCIYKGCKTHDELICFPHIESNPLQEVIAFLNLEDIILSKENSEQLKQCWKENKILHTSGKNGTIYKGKTDTYLAFIPKRIEEFLK